MTMIKRIYFHPQDYEAVMVIGKLLKGNLHAMRFEPIVPEDIGPYSEMPPEGRIRIPDEKAVLIWGNGHNHKLSYFFRPDRPYHKSVVDAHMDFYSLPSMLTHVFGTNHNMALVLNDDNLQSLEVLGVTDLTQPPSINFDIPNKGKTVPLRFTPEMSSALVGKTVQESIELDAIKGYPCNAPHGLRTAEEVKKSFEDTLRNNDVVRLDVGGFSREGNFSKFLRGIGIKEYEELIELYLSYN